MIAYAFLARPTVASILYGVPFALVGLGIRGWAAGAIRKNREVTTHGPYAFTRNPLYLGSLLIGVGFAAAGGPGRWPWFLAVVAGFFGLVYGRVMRREEERLADLFGEEFVRYRAAVPRFVPRLAPWSDVTGATSPARSGGVARPDTEASPAFQFKRYLAHREYQALLGVGAMFLLLVAKLFL